MNEMAVPFVTLLASRAILVILLALYIAVVFFQASLFTRWITNGKATRVIIYMVVTFFTFWLLFSAFFAVVVTMCRLMKKASKIAKERQALYNNTALNPSIEAVNELKAFIEKHGCINAPNEWNQLRAVWISCNESENIPTQTKKELKQFLMLKGLTMHHKDAEIIDNYNN